MTDPVTAEDGFIYERSAIEKWFGSGFSVSPHTGQEIGKSLESNSDLYQIIKSFKAFLRNTDSSLDLTLAHPGPDGNAQSITLSRGDVCETEPVQMFPALSAFFKELNKVEGLPESTLTALIPLKIAFVADDSWLPYIIIIILSFCVIWYIYIYIIYIYNVILFVGSSLHKAAAPPRKGPEGLPSWRSWPCCRWFQRSGAPARAWKYKCACGLCPTATVLP